MTVRAPSFIAVHPAVEEQIWWQFLLLTGQPEIPSFVATAVSYDVQCGMAGLLPEWFNSFLNFVSHKYNGYMVRESFNERYFEWRW
ncbi:hypothetical protein VNO78_27211 [Psophocarpus tetragonolobus]|uniref:Uncharacterized protein n=1 Tax=Psophocarpus tetragonolobus TaxID=3891 RepID=A0AAN9S244_PSOTE